MMIKQRVIESLCLHQLVLLMLIAIYLSEVRSFGFKTTRYVVNHYQNKLVCNNKLRVYCSSQPLSDETLEEWLDDMIYSGDIEGFIRKRSRDVVSDDFKVTCRCGSSRSVSRKC